VRWIARAACYLFYRVDRAGRVPPSGPVLVLPNHPNALLDPAAIWATSGRDIRFLAKSTLFEGPLRPLLRGAGAIPVYRRLDRGVDASRNAETFAAVDAALAAGDAVCMFPEGVSHSTGRLEALRTGAARMALSAERRGVAVALVAAGLNFDRKTAFRSRVTVLYGDPFTVGDLCARPDPDAVIVRAITERIAGHMRRLLVEADPAADAALVDRVDRLYAAARGRAADPQERVARRRVIAHGIERLRAEQRQRYDDLLVRIRRYDQRLRRFGLEDRHLDWGVGAAGAWRFAARELLFAVPLVPVAAVGLAVFFPPYRLTGIAARASTSDTDVAATAKVGLGAVIHAAWLAAVAGAAWALSGAGAAVLVAAAMPVLAVAALFAIEREAAVLDTVRAWLQLRRSRRQTQARLRRTRSELAGILDEVHAWLTERSDAVSRDRSADDGRA
jgi:1-acyl-sn-glycerol-3-phosphate acyltransferase